MSGNKIEVLEAMVLAARMTSSSLSNFLNVYVWAVDNIDRENEEEVQQAGDLIRDLCRDLCHQNLQQNGEFERSLLLNKEFIEISRRGKWLLRVKK